MKLWMKRAIQRPLQAFVVLVVCLGRTDAAVPNGKPLLIELPPNVLPQDVGANGFVVVGDLYASGGDGGGFYWMPTSGVEAIGGTHGTAVSRDGKTIVGDALDERGLEHAAIWMGGEQWRLLGSIASDAQPCDRLLSAAYGTNADGRVVVGLAWNTCRIAHAFRWEETTGMVDLGSTNSKSSRANNVSGDGRVVVGAPPPATSSPLTSASSYRGRGRRAPSRSPRPRAAPSFST